MALSLKTSKFILLLKIIFLLFYFPSSLANLFSSMISVQKKKKKSTSRVFPVEIPVQKASLIIKNALCKSKFHSDIFLTTSVLIVHILLVRLQWVFPPALQFEGMLLHCSAWSVLLCCVYDLGPFLQPPVDPA